MENQKNNSQLYADVENLVAAGQHDEALAAITAAIAADENDSDLYYQRGRLLWKIGRKTEAMSDYAAASQLDPSSPATAALEMAREIMDFYHRDRYNP